MPKYQVNIETELVEVSRGRTRIVARLVGSEILEDGPFTYQDVDDCAAIDGLLSQIASNLADGSEIQIELLDFLAVA